MRFIHTSDWHLGRLFHGLHLTADQAHLLEQLVTLARESRPDAILISGDLYDRAVPPPEAVELLDQTLSRLVLDLGLPVVVIAGNHDSGRRLGFASRMLSAGGLHLHGALEAARPVSLEDDAGIVQVVPLPFAEPALTRQFLGREEIDTHQLATAALIDHFAARWPRRGRTILMAHATVATAEQCESERPLSLGGSDAIDASLFEPFHYVALGHLHRPQSVDEEEIRYSGSLMKYSFSEAEHEKSVTLVEMDHHGDCHLELIPLSPRRDVRCVEGLLKELLDGPGPGQSREDYLQITLLDQGPILDVMNKLREVYPNVLSVRRPYLTLEGSGPHPAAQIKDRSHMELFDSFFMETTGAELSPELAAAYRAVVEKLRAVEREA